MSGLAALFHRDGRPADRAAVEAMLAGAPHRGPDGRWIRLAGPVAMGFAKLAVTPEEEAEVQPLVSPRTGCWIVAEARLDNRDDLLARLPDRPPPTASDAELILRAHEAWGVDAAERLLGDFAFMIWDPRHQRLVCARDTAGQCALFYRLDGSSFFAASEIQQLLQDPSVPIEADDDRIRDYLLPMHVMLHDKDSEATFYRGISALRAGHLIVVDRDAHAVRRYWQLEPPGELRYRRDEDYAEHYRSLFYEVVRTRLRTSRPIGVMLSGGLDSASVACASHELYQAGRAETHGFTSFSFVFDEDECDERRYIEDIQNKYGFPARYIRSTDFVGRLRLDPDGFQEVPDVSLVEARAELYSEASEAGVRALLTGDVADYIVGSSPLVFDSLLRRGDLIAFWRHIQAHHRRSPDSWRAIAGLYCLMPLSPLGLQKWAMSACMARADDRQYTSLLPAWLSEPLRRELLVRLRQSLLAAERARRFANPARELEYRLVSPPESALRLAGWPVQIWRPYTDRRLHEFLLSIPPEQKYAPHPSSDELYAGSKWLVRRAMQGIVPESIRTRTTKTRFRTIFENEILRDWPVYEAAFGPTGNSEIAVRGYIDREAFWSTLQRVSDGALGPLELAYVKQLVWLETWLRRLRQPRPELVTVRPLRTTELAGAEELLSTSPSRSRRATVGTAVSGGTDMK